jgi:hypothetical protein
MDRFSRGDRQSAPKCQVVGQRFDRAFGAR